MRLKKLAAGVMTTVMAMSMMCVPSFAATETFANGDYVGTVHMMNATNPANYSMCDGFFDNSNAQVSVTDDATIIKLHVVSPVTVGASTSDTLGETKVTFDGKEYTAEVDSTYAEGSIEWPTSVPIGSVVAGESRTYQILTITLPAAAVDSLDEGLTATATVNAMGYAPEMLMKITALTIPSTGDPVAGDGSRSMDVTADVPAKAASYSVTIPSSVAMGTLKTDADTTTDFSVNVVASGLNGTISVEAPAGGALTSKGNTLNFTNSFGTKTVSADTTGTDLTGTLTVAKDAVVAAPSGNYTGTTTFTFSYTAN